MEVLEWAYRNGRKPSEEDVEIWNNFMRGALTMFDFIDLDEERTAIVQ